MTPSQAAQRLRNIERALKQAEATDDPQQVRALLVPFVRQQEKQARKVLTNKPTTGELQDATENY